VTDSGEIRSIRSPRVKSARQLARRSIRQRARSFLAEGPQAVREALDWPEVPGTAAGPVVAGPVVAGPVVAGPVVAGPVVAGPVVAGTVTAGARGPGSGVVTELFVTAPARSRHNELVELAAGRGAAVSLVSGEVMAELAQTVTPQGLLAVCRFIDVPLQQLVSTRPRLAVLLANVRDPGNAGTVLRTADAAGADGVIFSDASVDPYNSKCVRASAGSLFHLPLVAGCGLAEAAAALHGAGLRVLAADGGAGLELGDLSGDGSLSRPTAWLFGNEAWGLPAGLLALADQAVAVPIYGKAESLNLAAAAAVCLYASAGAQRSRLLRDC
jgi:RNA methyltransferase, TrmH family